MTAFSDHLNTVRDVLNMAEVPYVDDFYRALAALDAIEAAWNSAYDLPTPRLIAEVERLRAELAAAHAERADLRTHRQLLLDAATQVLRFRGPRGARKDELPTDIWGLREAVRVAGGGRAMSLPPSPKLRIDGHFPDCERRVGVDCDCAASGGEE